LPQRSVRHARIRTRIAKSVLHLVRMYSKTYFRSDAIGEHAIDILIGMTVMQAQAEAKPMTAGDVGAALGMPRTTVLRRLSASPLRDVVAPIKIGRRLIYLAKEPNRPEVINSMREAIQHLHSISAELSKLDKSARDG